MWNRLSKQQSRDNEHRDLAIIVMPINLNVNLWFTDCVLIHISDPMPIFAGPLKWLWLNSLNIPEVPHSKWCWISKDAYFFFSFFVVLCTYLYKQCSTVFLMLSRRCRCTRRCRGRVNFVIMQIIKVRRKLCDDGKVWWCDWFTKNTKDIEIWNLPLQFVSIAQINSYMHTIIAHSFHISVFAV